MVNKYNTYRVARGKMQTPPFIEVKSELGLSRLMSTFFREFQHHI